MMTADVLSSLAFGETYHIIETEEVMLRTILHRFTGLTLPIETATYKRHRRGSHFGRSALRTALVVATHQMHPLSTYRLPPILVSQTT